MLFNLIIPSTSQIVLVYLVEVIFGLGVKVSLLKWCNIYLIFTFPSNCCFPVSTAVRGGKVRSWSSSD